MPPNAGYISAIKAEGTPYVKVGYTTRSVDMRRQELRKLARVYQTSVDYLLVDVADEDDEAHAA